MADIFEFLTARQDEAERDAKLAAEAGRQADPRYKWIVEEWHSDDPAAVPAAAYVNDEHEIGVAVVNGSYAADHIARHDPARVLAEVAAQRRVMGRHRAASGNEPGWYSYAGACIGCGTEGEFADPRTRRIDDCPELRDLAAPDANHPDYNPAWSLT